MTEYRVVCDRGVINTDGATVVSDGVEVGVPPITPKGIALYEQSTWNDKRTANSRLKRAKMHCQGLVINERKRTYQYNFRIQSREVTDWRDEK